MFRLYHGLTGLCQRFFFSFFFFVKIRFGEAVEAIQLAAKLDRNNREVSMVLRRVQAVTAARSKGNDFFKTGRFQEASAAYGEGLDHDSRNSVLLCNRAACLFKMGQFDRAIGDSTAALSVRPAYAKARLRRADCNAKVVCVNSFKNKMC